MQKLIEIIAYILDKYPYKGDLSNARVTKMIYLADWKSLINYNYAISNIRWYFDNYGPFVWDISNIVETNKDIFDVIETSNMFGTKKVSFSLKKNIEYNLLTRTNIEIIDLIIKITKGLSWKEFIKFVYSTYPIVSSERYVYLDLDKKLQEFKDKKTK